MKKIFFVLTLLSSPYSEYGLVVGQIAAGQALVIQSDQKTVVAGSATNDGMSSIVVARYTTDGLLDTRYGTQGASIINITDATDQYAYTMAIQSNDQVIVAGNCIIDGTSHAVAICLNTDGTINTEFANKGFAIISLAFPTSFKSVAIQKSGKIVLMGSYITDEKLQLILIRLNSDGSIDTSFGDKGYTITDLGYGLFPAAIALQSSDAILVSGTIQGNHFVTRYNPDGSLDTTFGSDGITITSLNNIGLMYAFAIDSSNSLYAAGSVNQQGIVLKYDSSGFLDNSFAKSGKLTFSSGTLTLIYGLECLEDSVLVAGSSSGFAMVGKIMSNGVFDTTFASGGIMRLTDGVDDSIAFSLGTQNDSKIVGGGSLCRGFLAFRLNTNGSLDTSFDTDGFINDPSGDPCKVMAALAG